VWDSLLDLSAQQTYHPCVAPAFSLYVLALAASLTWPLDGETVYTEQLGISGHASCRLTQWKFV